MAQQFLLKKESGGIADLWLISNSALLSGIKMKGIFPNDLATAGAVAR